MKEEKIQAKRLIVIGVIIFAIITVLGTASFKLMSNKGTPGTYLVTLFNDTAEQVSGLKVACSGIEKNFEVPTISPRGNSIIKINTFELKEIENELWVHYKEKNGKEYKHTIVGYFERSSGGFIEIHITSIDQNGILKLELRK